MSQKELAKRIGESTQLVNTWVKGKNCPRIGKIEKIANALNVRVGVLIDSQITRTHPVTTTGIKAVCFIYKITCNSSGRVYIGKTHNVESRKQSHIFSLRGGRHQCDLMQEDFEKYGEKDFTFEVIRAVPDRLDLERKAEIEEMIKARSYDRQYGYNFNDKYFYSRNGNITPLLKKLLEGEKL